MLWLNRFSSPDIVLRAPPDGGSSGFAHAESGISGASGRGRQAGAAGPLETTAKSVGQNRGRSDRFRWQRHAAGLLGGQHRVGLCRWSVVSKETGVDMVSSSYGEGPDRVHFEGLQTCGSVWACPCCSARISETRREEMGRLLAWARAAGYHVRMVTLTCRHGRDDDLADLMVRMKGRTGNRAKGIETFRGAKQRMVDDRRYRDHVKPHVIGSVTATEVTGGGAHGWHPHMHMILILDEDIDLTPMRDAWLGSLRGAGLEGSGRGWDVRPADETGQYIAKWGAAEELALSGQKKGRGSGRTPTQLLASSCDDGDRVAGELWAEYATVFHGLRQLVWSRGLKDRAGIDEIEDEEAAQDQQQDGQQEIARANIPHRMWVRSVATRRHDGRGELLARSEEIGPEQAVSELISGPVPDDPLIEEDTSVAAPPVIPGGLRDLLMRSVLARFQSQNLGVDNRAPPD